MEGMKKTGILHMLFVIASVLCIYSCTKYFEDYNHNPNEATDEELERDNYNWGSKLLQLQSNVIPVQEHLYQFTEILAGMAYGGYAESTVDSWSTKFSTFNPSSDWLKAPFVDVMTETYAPYRGIMAATDDPLPLALAKVLRVAIMHRVTDQYGPIPYSQILENKQELLTVQYDSQKDVYLKMFEELDEAVSVLKDNIALSTEAFNEYDLVYGGNISRWILFANSLKLRMAMRLSEVDPTIAMTKAMEAIEAGVIEANTDNARYKPTTNRCAMIWNDWQDHVVSADLASYLNGYSDPRATKMFTIVNGQVAGLRIGSTPAVKADAIAYCSFPVVSDDDSFLWINAAEVSFLRAEWELRWGTRTNAEELYRNGVSLSFEDWGCGDASSYLEVDAKPMDFENPLVSTTPLDVSFAAMSTITPMWNDADDFETALERIITQKWIAIFPLGNEAWAEYRRTGYPKLAPVPEGGDKSGGTVTRKYGARRLSYPSEEYAENRENVTTAVTTLLGGTDNLGTRVWWDCKKLN